MKNTLFIVLKSFCILFFILACNKEDKKSPVIQVSPIQKNLNNKDSGPINLPKDLTFITEEFRPFNFTENRILTGISVDILLRMRKILNLPLSIKDIKVYPWARGYQLAQKPNKKNILFSMSRSKKRENLFKWVGPIAVTNFSLFGRGIKKNISFSDIKKKKIGVVRKDIGEFLLKERNYSENYIIRQNDVATLIKLLKSGKLDYFVYGEDVTWDKIKDFNFNKADFHVSSVLQKGTLYFAFNKSISDSVVNSYQMALNKVLKDPEFKALLDKKYR